MDKDICPLVTVASGFSMYKSISKTSGLQGQLQLYTCQGRVLFKSMEGYSILHYDLQNLQGHIFIFWSMSKGWPQDFVFMLQMDAEAEDKTLRTRSKGTKGELASRFHDTVPTIPWNMGVPMLSP